MKKILIMVLCLIMAAMPVVAEKTNEITVKDYAYMYAEPREDFFTELGVETVADGEDIMPAGEGWYVVSARNEKILKVYVPNEGWKIVDFSELSEDAYESFNGRVGGVIKNNHYIYLVDNGNPYLYMIDLVEYKIRDTYAMGEYRLGITNDGYLYNIIIEDEKTSIQFVGFRQVWDLAGLGTDILLHSMELTNEHLVVVYANGNSELHAAWINKDGSVAQDNYLFPAIYIGEMFYSKTTDTLIYNHGGSKNEARIAISNINGDTKVVFCDYEEDLQGTIILGTTSEFVVADAEDVVYAEVQIASDSGFYVTDGGYPESINGESTNREVYIGMTPVALIDNDRFLLLVSENNYTTCLMDITTGEMVEVDIDKDERMELFNAGRINYNMHWTTGEIIPCANIGFKLVK